MSVRVIARCPVILLTAVILLALRVLAPLSADSSWTPAGQVAYYLFHPDVLSISYNINVLHVQRTIMDVLVSAALAAVGAVMQAVTRSSLAEPGLLGVNASASLGIVLGTVMLGVLPISDQSVLAAGGALVATALAQVIGMIGAPSSSPIRLVLIGIAFSAFTGVVIRGVALTMPSLPRTFIDREVGSLTCTDIPLLLVVALVVAGIGVATLLAGVLDDIALGDDVVVALGTRVALMRSLSLVIVTVLCVTATTVAGPIGLVGLMAPLTTLWLMGPHRGWIAALCTLGGSVVVLATDVLGCVLARPGEMQVGLLTAFVGSLILLLMVLRMKDRASQGGSG